MRPHTTKLGFFPLSIADMDALIQLCVDDNPRLLELRKALLESYGYRVKIALSGHTAMRMLRIRQFPLRHWSTK